MSEKKSFGEKLEAFFAGKGFYIVLFLCVAVIGVSTYVLFAGNGANVEEGSLSIPETNIYVPEINEQELAEPPETYEQELIEPEPEQSLEEITQTEETGAWSDEQAEISDGAPFVWPVQGEITVPYSVTALIYNQKMGDWRTSESISIASELGTQVMAVSAGIVESVRMDDLGGMTVVIQHAGGLRTVYSNLASMPTVYE
ncbi:MAG: M23 family metallopeptidase, partial [Clostridiales bacterium]|nr:M23 family metallopeptidase [Clostridiales bacterium]